MVVGGYVCPMIGIEIAKRIYCFLLSRIESATIAPDSATVPAMTSPVCPMAQPKQIKNTPSTSITIDLPMTFIDSSPPNETEVSR